MNILPALLILLTATSLLYSNISKAGKEVQSHSSIITTVKQFLESQVKEQQHSQYKIKVGHLDSRLKLDQCNKDLEAFMAPGSRLTGKTTVGIRCSAPRPWSLYVPATINPFSLVYKTAFPLEKGHTITDKDLTATEHNLTQLNHGYFTDKTMLIGKQTRRRLKQNHVITPQQIKAALMVKRGEEVALIAKSNSFSIRMSGKAMMDGAKGDRIRVKNSSSKRIIEGIVTRNGVVTVIN
jgi:flagellar basal body P-ring formation protein FlgA